MHSWEVASENELRRASDDDALVMWAAQGFAPGVRAWRRRDAVAVASPYLSCRDRLAVHGPAKQVAGLIPEVLAEVGPTYRPIGDSALVSSLVDRVPGLQLARRCGWMQTDQPAPASGSDPGVRWLEPRWDALVAELLYDAYPNSYARPGLAGVRRWAGAVDSHGELAAVAADAWSAPNVGYLAGVATRPSARRQGFGLAAFRFALDTLVRDHGRAALMVDSANTGALGLYQRMGMRWRELGAACVPVRSSAA